MMGLSHVPSAGGGLHQGRGMAEAGRCEAWDPPRLQALNGG